MKYGGGVTEIPNSMSFAFKDSILSKCKIAGTSSCLKTKILVSMAVSKEYFDDLRLEVSKMLDDTSKKSISINSVDTTTRSETASKSLDFRCKKSIGENEIPSKK